MKFIHEDIAYGKRVSLFLNDNKVSEILLWPDLNDNKKLRINWLQTEKEFQNKGYGRELLLEIKKNIKNNFPSVDTIIFDSVTSLGVIKLIEKVFGPLEKAISPYLCEKRKEELRFEKIDLPERSPAKYDKFGNAKLSKNAKKVNFMCFLN